jgi:LPS sulfotransferase NodH
VLYEELDDDPVGIASGVLGFLGLDLPAGREITVRHKRLADELNARWVESYRLHEARERQGRPSGAGAGGCGG